MLLPSTLLAFLSKRPLLISSCIVVQKYILLDLLEAFQVSSVYSFEYVLAASFIPLTYIVVLVILALSTELIIP